MASHIVNVQQHDQASNAILSDHAGLSNTDNAHYFPPPPTSSAPRVRAWRPSFYRAGPISGVFALLLALMSIAASLGVLAGSNGATVESWSAQPSIYLAICTAVANFAMRYACIQGVVICWWLRACRGSTLSRLHYDWRSGTSIRGAVTSGKHLGLLGLAMIFSTVVIMDGPLLQRASTVVVALYDLVPVPLNITMAQQIPTDYTGYWATVAEAQFDSPWSPQFNRTAPSVNGTTISNEVWAADTTEIAADVGSLYYDNLRVPNVVNGCPGTCKALIKAPALAVGTCTPYQLPVDYNEAESLIKGQSELVAAGPLNQQAFMIASYLVTPPNGQEWINLLTGYSHTKDCNGTLHYTACSLHSATGEYEVSITNNIVTLLNASQPRIIDTAQNSPVRQYDPEAGAHLSTLAGIVSLHQTKYQAEMAAYMTEGAIIAWQTVNPQACDPYILPPLNQTCNSYRDPLRDMLGSLNKAMFYTGSIAARETLDYLDARMDQGIAANTNISITGYEVGNHNVFHTDYWWFLAAAVVELVCVCFVAPTYWGWWKLGRSMSFSSLEIAKSFQAPMLADCDSNSRGRDVAKAMGDVPVRYAVPTGDDSSQSNDLAFVRTTSMEECKVQPPGPIDSRASPV